MKRTYNLAGICSILVGIFSLLASVAYFLLPDAQKLGVPGNQILPSFAQDPTMLNIENLTLGLGGLFALAVVPAVAQLWRDQDNAWLRWSSNLANVGYAVSAVGSFVILSRLPVIAAAYMKGDAATQAALAATWRTTLDPFGVWGYGAVGLWMLIVSLAMMRDNGKRFPQPLAYVGMASAIFNWLVPIAFVIKMPALFFIVAGGGAVVISVWYVWLGLTLRRMA